MTWLLENSWGATATVRQDEWEAAQAQALREAQASGDVAAALEYVVPYGPQSLELAVYDAIQARALELVRAVP